MTTYQPERISCLGFFGRGPLSEYLNQRRERLYAEIDTIETAALLQIDEVALVAQLMNDLKLSLVSLDVKEAFWVWDPFPRASDTGWTLCLYIPCHGSTELLQYYPGDGPARGPSHLAGRDGKVGNQVHCIGVTDLIPPGVPPEEILRRFQEKLQQLQQMLQSINAQVEKWGYSVRDEMLDYIRRARDNHRHFYDMAKRLSYYPTRPGGQGPFPYRVELPEVPIGFDVSSVPTHDKYPCLNEKQYEWILTALRSSGAVFEQHPHSYSEMLEPTLRDFMLHGLNNGPGMQACAERFRNKGKTDICLEFPDHCAFIAECKNWGGEKVVHQALSQLLGYLTWRDCKAALVIFNLSVAGFSEIQAKLRAALQSHPHFVQEIPGQPLGEWRVVVKSPDDPARQITVHVFLFNLFTRKEAP